MASEVWNNALHDSPCIRMCMIHHKTKICHGCGRSLDEISRWGFMTNEERREVLENLPTRRRKWYVGGTKSRTVDAEGSSPANDPRG